MRRTLRRVYENLLAIGLGRERSRRRARRHFIEHLMRVWTDAPVRSCKGRVVLVTRDKVKAGELPRWYYPYDEYVACVVKAQAAFWEAHPELKEEYEELRR